MRVGGLAVAVISWAIAAPGSAQQEFAEPTLKPMVVEGHLDNSVGTSDAASEGTVTSRLIEDRPALRPGEVLEFVPGVIVTQHSGDGKANQYFLRGFNLDHGTDFATFLDGMPLNMRSHAHGQGYTDLNFLIPELISRIDYRKGPYFADDGDFANAGSARIGYVGSLDRPFASAAIGEDGYRRLLAAGSRAAGPGALLAALEVGHNNGPWDVPEGFRKLNAVLRWSMARDGDRVGVTAMGYGARWTSTDQIPMRAVSEGLIGRFGSLDPSDGGRTARVSLSLDWARSLADGAFRLNAYAVHSRLDLYNDFTYQLNHPFDLGDPIDGDQFHQSECRLMTGLSATRAWAGRLGSADMTNRLGLQWRYDRVDPLALTETVQRQYVDTIRSDKVREGSVGLFVENAVQWTSWLRTVAGLRYDRYSFSVDSDNPVNSGDVDAHIVSPKLSAIFGPWRKTEFFANYGQGFHSNDARGTTTHVDPQTGAPLDPVTPLVKTHGAEVGTRTEIVPGLQSSLALWQLRLASELVFSGDAGDTEASRASLRRGIEWSNHWVLRRWLLLDLDLSASRARFTQDDPVGNYIPGSIGRAATFGLTVPDYQGWFGALQWRYFGPRPLIEDNSQRSASTSLVYLRLGRQLDPSTRLTLDIFNLFNREASDIDYYYASRLAGEPAAGVGDIHFHPVEPRTARLTLVVRF
ncbi:MAG TPA: TonB-dependent receptor [Burkholderiales bacterium]|nr:TonB-dependent receptor [Burkholderiales bacterium]